MHTTQNPLFKRDVILILAASFFYMASPMLITPLITGFSQELGASGTVMGLVGGLMNLCSLFCRPFVGDLSDKISKYKFSFLGIGLMSAACIGYICAPSTAVVLLARIVNGIGFSCCSVCMSTWMSNLLPQDKIGSGMGLYGTMNALAMAVAPAIGVSIHNLYGYRISFALALLFAIAAMLVIQLVHDKGQPTCKPEAGKKAALHFIDPKAVPVALVIMLFAIPYCATQSFLVSYTEAREVHVQVGLYFPMYAAFLLILRLSLKSLFDKLPFCVFLGGSCVSAALGMLFLSFMQNDLEMLLAALFMSGGYGIMCSVCQSTAILMAGPEHRGLANSTYYVGLDVGMALGPMIGGVLYESVDLALFYPVLMLTVPLCVVVYISYIRIRRRYLRSHMPAYVNR